MAMSKKDKETLAQLQRYGSFYRTEQVLPDIPAPEAGSLKSGGLVTGYVPIGAGAFTSYGRVEPACSSTHSHGTGSHTRTRSQKSIAMHSTRSRALRALRWEVEQQFIDALHKIDKDIDAALEEEARQDP